MDQGFQAFSFTHFATLVLVLIFTMIMIRIGQKAEGKMKIWIGYAIASASLAVLLIDLGIRFMQKRLDVLVDLPLFMCDLAALALPFIILQENRKWIGIFYFWALAGTLQALITPELNSNFPSFEFFRYFIMHGAIVSAVMYYVIVMKVIISWKDLLNAVIYAQVYLVIVHILNMVLGSNYSYTMAKPAGPTILDLFGNWPWYILCGELLMIILFVLLLIPFLIIYRKDDLEEI